MTNLDKLAEIFPECITETADADGNLIRAVNFDRLRQMLSTELVEGREAYEFNFVGKKQAALDAAAHVDKTLRPVRHQSRDFDTTPNLYVEGDNLDALKLLQESFLGKVKLIYIDPPYNTGNDFIYRDNFTRSAAEYSNLELNRESRGRFHSDWCAMIYARLLRARDFLADDGVIFISIDDHEQANLKKICDEIFGEKNFVAELCIKRSGGRQDSKFFAVVNEYIICYAKDSTNFTAGEAIKTGESYPKFDVASGRNYKTQLLRKWGANSRRVDRPNLFYPIPAPDGSALYPMLSATEEGCWRWGKDKMRKAFADGLIDFVKNGDGWIAYEKIFEPIDGKANTKKFTTWIDESFAGGDAVKNLLGDKVFPYPKSVGLIEHVLKMGNVDADSIVMDFFSGSATTAHAVMELNANDGGRRKFIMIQIDEPTPENSEARRAGYATLCEIGKERIRRAGDKLKAENPNLDTGFRVLKVDSSNYIEPPEKFRQKIILELIDNIKPDRDAWDLLFGELLRLGKRINLPVEREEICGFEVLNFNGGEIFACFDKNLPSELLSNLTSRKPERIILRDMAFKTYADKLNALEFIKKFSPNTEVNTL